MKIFFDSQAFVLQKFGGISRHFVSIFENFDKINVDYDVMAPYHRNVYLRDLNHYGINKKFIDFHIPKSSRLIISLNKILSAPYVTRFRPNVFHHTYYYSQPVRGASNVVTVYDMTHEVLSNKFSPFNDTTRNKLRVCSTMDHIVAISNSTKSDLVNYFDIPDNKISVIHCGYNKLSFSDFSPVDFSYVLFVGNRGGYKNFVCLLRAFSSSSMISKNFKLVAFGGGSFTRDEKKLIKSLRLEAEVLHMSGDDFILGTLYKHASLMVYPSMYEGFGFPPLEAMSLGCPVVCSNTSSMPEVSMEAAVYFDPANFDELRSVIEDTLLNPARLEFLRTKGFERVKSFSWEKCAIESLNLYKKLT